MVPSVPGGTGPGVREGGDHMRYLKGYIRGSVRYCEHCAEARWGRLVLFGSFFDRGPQVREADIEQCDACHATA